MNKKYINHATVASYLSLVVEKMYNDGFDPDLVVGLSRGGLVPGIMLSHFLKKPFVPIEASLRDHPTWNANSEKFSQVSKICIIDDICDTGDTFKKLKQELKEALPDLEVKFASLHHNTPANFKPNWYGALINKDIKDVWLVYPWEDWFDRDTVENTLVNEMLGNI